MSCHKQLDEKREVSNKKLVVRHWLVFSRWGLSLALSLCQPLLFDQLQGTPQHNLWQLGTAFVLCPRHADKPTNRKPVAKSSFQEKASAGQGFETSSENYPSLPPAIFSSRDGPNLMGFIWLATISISSEYLYCLSPTHVNFCIHEQGRSATVLQICCSVCEEPACSVCWWRLLQSLCKARVTSQRQQVPGHDSSIDKSSARTPWVWKMSVNHLFAGFLPRLRLDGRQLTQEPCRVQLPQLQTSK